MMVNLQLSEWENNDNSSLVFEDRLREILYGSLIVLLPSAAQQRLLKPSMDDSSYRLNFDQGKKNEIQHHS
jgi:hypothetical protein